MITWNTECKNNDGIFGEGEPNEANVTPGLAIGEPLPNSPTSRTITPLVATIVLARRGRKEILPKLRQTLDEHPELWSHFGDLCHQSQEIWIRLIANKDLYLLETIRRHLDAMRKELAAASSTPLERLLVDRILATHVQVLYFEACEAQILSGRNPKLDDYRLRRQDQANRQFLTAVKTLAAVRQLMSRTVLVELIPRQAESTPLG